MAMPPPISDSSAGTTGLRAFMSRDGWAPLGTLLVVDVACYLVVRTATNPGVAYLVSFVGIVLLLLYLGWADSIFGRQPIYASDWMWAAPILVLIPSLLRVFGIGWGHEEAVVLIGVAVVFLVLAFVEEVMSRGFIVKMLRDRGHGEFTVAVISSAFFAVMHIPVAFAVQSVRSPAVTVTTMFGVGVVLYVTLRVTGFLIWTIVLHAAFNTFTLISFGVPTSLIQAPVRPASADLIEAAKDFQIVFLVAGLLMLPFIRGNVRRGELDRPSTLVVAVRRVPWIAAGVGVAVLGMLSFAGDGTATFNESHWLDRRLEKRVLEYRGLQVTTECPDGVVAERGKTFSCIQTNPDGSTVVIDVTFKDDKGATRAVWNPVS